MSRLRRPLALVIALLAGGGLTACGNHPDESARIVRAENEGLYLDIGSLKYQVQGSRQLNPHDVQDRALLGGIAPSDQGLKPDEVWFGVFMRVQNETDSPVAPAGDIKIVDTQETEYRPLALGKTNLFAYRSTQRVPANETIPLEDTPSFDTPVRGTMLLFKLTLTSLANRPLELEIQGTGTPQQTGIIELDV